MDLTKFLIIDGSFILIGLPFLLIFQGNKAKETLLRNINEKPMALPSHQTLIDLEKIAIT